MKRLAAVTLALSLLVGCKTSPETASGPEVREEASRRPAPRAQGDEPVAIDTVAGPFEIAEAWIESPDGAPPAVLDLLRRMEKPVVERMHRVTENDYRALVAAAGGGDEAVLLTIVQADVGWRVKKQEIIDADYLWPKP